MVQYSSIIVLILYQTTNSTYITQCTYVHGVHKTCMSCEFGWHIYMALLLGVRLSSEYNFSVRVIKWILKKLVAKLICMTCAYIRTYTYYMVAPTPTLCTYVGSTQTHEHTWLHTHTHKCMCVHTQAWDVFSYAQHHTKTYYKHHSMYRHGVHKMRWDVSSYAQFYILYILHHQSLQLATFGYKQLVQSW